MCCGFAGTDNTTHFHTRFMFWSRPRVYHDHISGHTNGMPSFIFRVWILPVHHMKSRTASGHLEV